LVAPIGGRKEGKNYGSSTENPPTPGSARLFKKKKIAAGRGPGLFSTISSARAGGGSAHRHRNRRAIPGTEASHMPRPPVGGSLRPNRRLPARQTKCVSRRKKTGQKVAASFRTARLVIENRARLPKGGVTKKHYAGFGVAERGSGPATIVRLINPERLGGLSGPGGARYGGSELFGRGRRTLQAVGMWPIGQGRRAFPGGQGGGGRAPPPNALGLLRPRWSRVRRRERRGAYALLFVSRPG